MSVVFRKNAHCTTTKRDQIIMNRVNWSVLQPGECRVRFNPADGAV